jgi:hypothetical protein
MPKCPNCGGNREYKFVDSGRMFGPYGGWEWECKGCDKKKIEEESRELTEFLKTRKDIIKKQ